MNSSQIAEDQLDELRLAGPVAIDKCTHSLGVLGPGVARNEHFRQLIFGGIGGIRGVYTVLSR